VKWYQPRLASKPPAYVLERISDLLRASKTCIKSPSNARAIIKRVISQLEEHMDEEYLADLQRISGIILDSPPRAKALIEVVMARMESDKEIGKKPWLKNLLK
jgi:hypothetical protein